MTNLYRCVLDINPASPVATDIGELHKLVMAGFRDRLEGVTTTTTPDGADVGPRAHASILFATKRNRPGRGRSRPIQSGNVTRVLVQGDTAPDWSQTSYASDALLTLKARPPIAVDTTVQAGDLVEITGDFNATWAKWVDGKRGQRITLTRPADIGAWLARSLDLTHDVGEVLPSGATISAPIRVTGTREGSRLMFSMSHVTAHLQVRNPDAFTNLLVHGLGRRRAYGAGLIRHRVLNPQ